MVSQQENGTVAPLAHRHALTARVIILDHRERAGNPLEVVAHVVGGGCCTKGRLHAVAVAVIREAGARRAAHSGPAVFGVVSAVRIAFTSYPTANSQTEPQIH
jgi:hypothetical protein